ncbi:hypothetical protein [Aureibacillus halotolerans]|uniref:Type IV pilus assembly protein PilO n=1 Tax=Aureibacillus halotolerans TaxID=1508390 RepID=A0A4R6TZH0_9BACI|nr:hypothetical protein [Aureibacillus halotolerans]TDQ38282.1 hypothetical protein EV213_11021 [Aureibacillus halotolerans]
MKKLKRTRNSFLLIGLSSLFLLTCLLFVLQFILPMLQEKTLLQQSLAGMTQAISATAHTTVNDTDESLELTDKKVPASPQEEALLRALSSASKKAKVTVTAISFQSAVQLVQEVEEEVLELDTDWSDDDAEVEPPMEPSDQVSQGIEGVYPVRMMVTVEVSSYTELQAFLQEVDLLERFVGVESVSAPAFTTDRNSVDMVLAAYYIPRPSS